jgi:bzd-type benzoyl-CoA reductase N subunit
MEGYLKVLNELKEVSYPFPQSKAIQDWKAKGKKVIGWICTYIPEEIIAAADMLPIRVIGAKAEEITEADAYLYANTCTFARGCLEIGLRKDYDFLDGIVSGTSCDPVRRLFDIWNNYLQTPFKHIVSVPHKITPEAEEFFANQLRHLEQDLEEFFQVKITPDKLKEMIVLYNKTRELFRELYSLRKQGNPLLTGTETMEVVQASMRMPRAEFNHYLERLLDALKQRQLPPNGRPRLMVVGSILDRPEFINAIESLGAIVVTDELCTGTRFWWNLTDTEAEPIEALAKRYLNHPPCARMRPFSTRMDFVMGLIKEFKVEGVIYEIIKFCDVYGHDKPIMKQKLEEAGVPVLELDLEYGMGGIGQIRTRVEAFLEMLRVK